VVEVVDLVVAELDEAADDIIVAVAVVGTVGPRVVQSMHGRACSCLQMVTPMLLRACSYSS